jgi:hypothetical protein
MHEEEYPDHEAKHEEAGVRARGGIWKSHDDSRKW